jgi:hypothetical protein
LITTLDTQSWAKELVTGNAEFIETSGPSPILYVVSNVRVNAGVYSFTVLYSTASPPAPGPGSIFNVGATYTFPNPTIDFDPVCPPQLDTSGPNPLLHIIGTQSNATNSRLVDLIKFTYDTVAHTLTGPILLVTGTTMRQAYDICLLNNGHTFVSVIVTDPELPILGQSTLTNIAITGNVLTVTTSNQFYVGQLVRLNGLTTATFLNGQYVQVTNLIGPGPVYTGFTANFVNVNYGPAADTGTATPTYPGHNLIAMELDATNNVVSGSLKVLQNSNDLGGQTFSSTSLISPDGINIEVYYQYHPKVITFKDQLFTIALFNRRTVAYITGTAILGNVLTVTCPNNFPAGTLVTLAGTAEAFLNGQTVTVLTSNAGSFTAAFVNPNYTNNSDTGTATVAAPIWDVLATTLQTFVARYTDDRMTVMLDQNGNRYLSQTFYSQFNHPYGYVGNLIMGYQPAGGIWDFHITLGSTTGGSIVQASISVNSLGGVNVAYLLEPFAQVPAYPGVAWPLHVATVNLTGLGLTDVPGFYNNLNFTWLRASKAAIDQGSDWAIVGEQQIPTTVNGELHTIPNVPGPYTVQVTFNQLTPTSGFAENLGVVYSPSGVPLEQVPTNPQKGQYTVEPSTGVYTFNVADAGAAIAISYSYVSAIVPKYVSFFNVPPVANLKPSTATVWRGNSAYSTNVWAITNVAVAGDVVTVTAPGNTFAIGESIAIYGLTTATFLNGVVLTVATANGTNFTASFTHGNYGPAADSGSAAQLILGAFLLDGSGTVDADQDPVYYFWSENYPDPVYPEWLVGTTYSLGQIVDVLGVQYISLQNGNLGNPPAASPTFWSVSAGAENVTLFPSGDQSNLTISRSLGGVGTTFNVGMAAVDEYAQFAATITAVEVFNNILTITANNSLVSGQQVVLYNLSHAAFLNGTVITVLASVGTNFTANYPSPLNYPVTADSGNAAVLRHPAYPITSVQLNAGALTVLAVNNFVATEQAMIYGVTLNPPAAPVLSSVAGGILPATTYYVVITYLNTIGETVGSAEASIAIAANNLPQVASPASPYGDAVSYNVYMGLTSGSEQLQNSSPVALGTPFTLSQYGIVTIGTPTPPPPPLVNTAAVDVVNDQVITVATATGTQFTSTSIAGTYAGGAATAVTGYVIPEFQFAASTITVPANVPPMIVMPDSAAAGPITNVQVATNVITVTVPNTFFVGQNVTITGLVTSPVDPLFEADINGRTLIVTGLIGAGPVFTGFTAAFVHLNYPSTACTAGTATPVTGWQLAPRNQSVTISPVITGVTDPDDFPIYTWVQVSGSPVTFPEGPNSAILTVDTNGVDISGENLVFQLTVNDSVNPPVSASVTLQVAPYNFAGNDTLQLSRSVWAAPIALRNTSQAWGTLDISAIFTNLLSVKRTSVNDFTDRYILISNFSVLVYGGENPNLVLLRKLFSPLIENNTTGFPMVPAYVSTWNSVTAYLPGDIVYLAPGSPQGNFVCLVANTNVQPPDPAFWAPYALVDAVHTEDDGTFVLDSVGNLFFFGPLSAPLLNTDNPDGTINLNNITQFQFNKVFTTPSYANVRILVLSGPDGCLLLQINNTTLQVQGFLELSVEDNLVYGADNVQFVRTSNVENLRSGKILIGTIAPLTAPITSVVISGNALSLTAQNSFSIGTVFTVSGIDPASVEFLNGRTFTAIAGTTGNVIVASLTAANVGPVAVSDAFATASNAGSTYETLIDLPHGAIIGTFDKSKLRNQFVNTGEILFEPNDTYTGAPLAPTLLVPTAVGNVVTLTWIQQRPDLVSSYNIQISTDGINFLPLQTVNSGFVESIQTTQIPGQTYYFRVNAVSLDGTSPYSNIEAIWVGTFNPPIINQIVGVATSGTALLDGFGNNFGVDFGGSNGYILTVTWTSGGPLPAQIGSYTIQMQVDGGAFSTLGTVSPGTNTSFTTVPLAGGHTYGFQVSAFVTAQAQNTAYSAVVSISIPLNIPAQTYPTGTVSVPYSAQAVATGGAVPYTFAVIAGSLPPGVNISNLGVFSGTPTASGTYSFVIQVTDSSIPSPFTDIALQSITIT